MRSLEPGRPGSLKVRPDGTTIDGHHRIAVLRQRGVDVDDLPSETLPGPWPRQLAILGRPRGNEWLVDEIRAWRSSGVHVVVSLLTDEENTELRLKEEKEISKNEGLEFLSFPIRDYSVPTSIDSVFRLIQKIYKFLSLGKFVGIHCRQSVGRSGLIAACLLVSGGDKPKDAFLQLVKSRGVPVPDTAEQREWVFRFAENLKSESDLLAAK